MVQTSLDILQKLQLLCLWSSAMYHLQPSKSVSLMSISVGKKVNIVKRNHCHRQLRSDDPDCSALKVWRSFSTLQCHLWVFWPMTFSALTCNLWACSHKTFFKVSSIWRVHHSLQSVHLEKTWIPLRVRFFLCEQTWCDPSFSEMSSTRKST